MKNTLAIAYNGGAYGTYLNWVLHTLTTADNIQLPFTTSGPRVGNSHKFKPNNQLLNMQEWRKYVASDQEHNIVRVHPKTLRDENLADNLDEILNRCNKVLLIYPDTMHEILCINNYMSKIWGSDNLYQGPLKDVDLSEIYNNFPVRSGTAPADIPRWILREYLSHWLVPAWRSQIDWFFPNTWQHKRCKIVYVSDLLNNLFLLVPEILKFWGNDAVKELHILSSAHAQMLNLQVHLGQDKLCNSIVDSVMDRSAPQVWAQLPIASESWLQWQLRNLGLEIKCHKLNCFPTSTVGLKKLLYKG